MTPIAYADALGQPKEGPTAHSRRAATQNGFVSLLVFQLIAYDRQSGVPLFIAPACILFLFSAFPVDCNPGLFLIAIGIGRLRELSR